MKTVNFIPSQCVGEEAEFSGMIVFKKLNFDEGLDLQEKLMDGALDEAALAKQNRFALLKRAVKMSESLIVEIKLVKLADGAAISSFSDMYDDADCAGILSEIGTFVASGLKVKKIKGS